MIKKFQIITELCRNIGMVPSPLQYSCLENPMDVGAWWATVQELDMTERLHPLHSLTPLTHSPSSSVHFISVAQSCPTPCDPLNCSLPGLPVHHQLLEFTQTHVHQVSDAIQPSHLLWSPSPPALNCSQHQGLFQ